KNKQPFNLTILTADTHFYDGYLCPDCEQTEDSQYSNVIRCSDKRVYSFVKWCETQEWYPNTTIILVGDHLTMDDEWSKKLTQTLKDRFIILFLIRRPYLREAIQESLSLWICFQRL
ncbi:sulfatase-like hydrolase/transferase, partial [Faecalibaculum rodentium]